MLKNLCQKFRLNESSVLATFDACVNTSFLFGGMARSDHDMDIWNTLDFAGDLEDQC